MKRSPGIVIVGAAMGASTILAGYFTVLLGMLVPKLFFAAYGLTTAENLDVFLPAITKIAVRFAWGFWLAIALIALGAVLWARRASADLLRILVVGLCSQALIVWLAFFCFFYEGFMGGGSFHREPEFSVDRFIGNAGGAFPITLMAILVPLLVAILGTQSDAATSTSK